MGTFVIVIAIVVGCNKEHGWGVLLHVASIGCIELPELDYLRWVAWVGLVGLSYMSGFRLHWYYISNPEWLLCHCDAIEWRKEFFSQLIKRFQEKLNWWILWLTFGYLSNIGNKEGAVWTLNLCKKFLEDVTGEFRGSHGWVRFENLTDIYEQKSFPI